MTKKITSQPKLIDDEEVRSAGSGMRKKSRKVDSGGNLVVDSAEENDFVAPIIQVETTVQDGQGNQSTVKGVSIHKDDDPHNKSITKRSAAQRAGDDMASLKSFGKSSFKSRKLGPAA